VTSEDEGRDLLRRGRTSALVILPKGFGKKISTPFRIEPPEVELMYDPARRVDASVLEGVLMKKASEVWKQSFADVGRMRESLLASLRDVKRADGLPPRLKRPLLRLLVSADSLMAADSSGGGRFFRGFEPLRILASALEIERSGPVNVFSITFPQGILWGIMGAVAGFAVGLVSERRSGTLDRLRSLPLRRGHILAGKALACFLATVGLSAALLLFGRLVFGVGPIHLVQTALAIGSASIGFVGIMMLFSVLGRTERAAAGVAWAAILPMAMLGGGMIPLIAMPGWLRSASVVSPVRWAILALEGGTWRGSTLMEMGLPCGILLGVGILAFAAGVRAMKWAE